jgi:beta-lactamase class A
MSGKWDWLEKDMAAVKGNASCWYRDLETGETFGRGEHTVHSSASIIKIFIMVYLFQKFEDGSLNPETAIPLRPEQIAPSAGVLSYLKDVREMSIRDLIQLMIIVSDNSATNVLIDLAGKEALNTYFREKLGLEATRVRRRMMDLDAIARGEDNTTSAYEAGKVLESLYRGTAVSPAASREMIAVLKNQQDGSLIPFFLDETLPEHTIAHKTGGLQNVVHDAALIDCERPFILCFFGSGVSVPEYSRLIQTASGRIFRER